MKCIIMLIGCFLFASALISYVGYYQILELKTHNNSDFRSKPTASLLNGPPHRVFTVQYAGRWYEWRPHWFHIPPTIMEEDDGGSHYHSLSLSFTRSLDYCQRKKVNVVKPEKLDVLWRSWFARAAAAVWGEHFVWHANDNLLWQLLGYLIHSTTPPPLSHSTVL